MGKYKIRINIDFKGLDGKVESHLTKCIAVS